MGKITRDESNPFVITPEEKAKQTNGNGNGVAAQNPFVIPPGEISNIKKK